MRALILCALFSIVCAKPGIYSSGWDTPSLSSVGLVHQPVQISQPIVHQVAQPIVQQVVAPSYVHAPVIAKAAATSYSSFQRVIHPPTLVHAPVVHAPVVQSPVLHAPLVQAAPVIHSPVVHSPVISQPLLPSYSEPIVSSLGIGSIGGISSIGGIGGIGHGW